MHYCSVFIVDNLFDRGIIFNAIARGTDGVHTREEAAMLAFSFMETMYKNVVADIYSKEGIESILTGQWKIGGCIIYLSEPSTYLNVDDNTGSGKSDIFKDTELPVNTFTKDDCVGEDESFAPYYECKQCDGDEIIENHKYCPSCGCKNEWRGNFREPEKSPKKAAKALRRQRRMEIEKEATAAEWSRCYDIIRAGKYGKIVGMLEDMGHTFKNPVNDITAISGHWFKTDPLGKWQELYKLKIQDLESVYKRLKEELGERDL